MELKGFLSGIEGDQIKLQEKTESKSQTNETSKNSHISEHILLKIIFI